MSPKTSSILVPPDDLKKQGQDRATSPFDYIIVGAGAGGGPLACRLAQAKKRVLLIDAGPDPKIAGVVHDAPLFHGAATEQPDLSWEFSVRHFEDDNQQRKDHKYDPRHDRSLTSGKPEDKGGIFYPRSSGLGGCTAHHAMIVVRPTDSDWDYIADLTNDDTWRASNMQPYFAKMENCLYLDANRGFFVMLAGRLAKIWTRFVEYINPKAVLDQGGHGRKGWQPTNFIAPGIIKKIIKTDNEFTTVLIKSAFRVIRQNSSLTAALKRYLIQFGFVRAFDPNDVRTRAANASGGVFLIPTGVGDESLYDENGESLKGRRTGVREFIRKTQEECKQHRSQTQIGSDGKLQEVTLISDYLVVEDGFHVERVLIEPAADGKPPRAVGVVGVKGDHLYRASPRSLPKPPPTGERLNYYVRHTRLPSASDESSRAPAGEVILSGGSFNTPQLLMLSGIGDREELRQFGIPIIADLPGVGRNLQDRYEVGVINELRDDLKTLETLAFDPNNPDDKLLQEWREKKEGLYTSNGGTVTILQRSSVADGPEWDLFTFGAPAAFRGYYWGWSRELLRPAKGAANDQRNLWTWVILKAFTRNNGGRVRLRSADPYDTPSICFHSFGEGDVEHWEKDVQAMIEAVNWMRAINQTAGSPFGSELQPAGYLDQANVRRKAAGEKEWTLRDWIINEAWGHHACGTCRIGSDPWRRETATLNDKFAVLDSSFRVHGVQGLRVVDASVFPKIPGYFILAPIFMISEKAAETLLREGYDDSYPPEVEQQDHEAILARRAAARVTSKNRALGPGRIPPPSPVPDLVEHRVGLALSGGGVRSATFSLGVVQALADKGLLRHVDFLSSVSGGCFTGSFLGRLFTRRLVTGSHDPAGRVQDILKDGRSNPMRWLRTQANYLFSGGVDDWLTAIGVYFRNVFTVHFVIGLLCLLFFGTLAGIANSHFFPAGLRLPPKVLPRATLLISDWWWAPLVFFLTVVGPMKIGFWLAPLIGSYRAHPPGAFSAWIILLIGAGAFVAFPLSHGLSIAPLLLLLLAWAWEEICRRGIADKTVEERRLEGLVVRNRLTRGLGEALVLFVALVGWVALDTLARTAAGPKHLGGLVGVLAILSPALPVLRSWVSASVNKLSPGPSALMQIAGFFLGLILLFVLDLAAHTLFTHAPQRWAWGTLAIALGVSVALGRSFSFLNLSSLLSTYAARVTRTFLGASNEARTTNVANVASDVSISHPDDDVLLHEYRPEKFGGPLHLISVCINETVDHASEREIRERRGVLMTVGSFGVSIGRKYFARWSRRVDPPGWLRLRRWLQGLDSATDATPPSLEAIRLNSDPGTFHPLGRQDDKPAVVETLSLGDWTAISGAAFSTGIGRETRTLECLLMGILNIRLGYWWDSGVRATERPGRFPSNIWRRLKELPGEIFETQGLLFAEWRGRFHGPSREFWNLSDGGHVDNSAIYELIRRRVEYIISTDATLDPAYSFECFANMVRQARVDFGVEIEWVRDAFADNLPPFLRAWVSAEALGSPEDIRGHAADGKPGQKHCALAIARYPGPEGKKSWILLLKASLTPKDPLDVAQFAKTHSSFPQDSTADQVYDDERWESYRHLGFTAATELFTPNPPVPHL